MLPIVPYIDSGTAILCIIAAFAVGWIVSAEIREK